MLTLQEVETAIVSRDRDALALAGRSLTTNGQAARNPDLNEPVARALGLFGHPAVSRSAVVDSDLAWVDDSLEERFLDLVELEVLESCLRKLIAQPNSVEWPNYKASWGVNVQYVRDLIAQVRDQYNQTYNQQGGLRVGRLAPGIRHKVRERFGRRRGHPVDLDDAEGCDP